MLAVLSLGEHRPCLQVLGDEGGSHILYRLGLLPVGSKDVRPTPRVSTLESFMLPMYGKAILSC